MHAEVKKLVVKSALRIIDPESLQVDPSYQRDVKVKHKRIVSEFDETAFGVPLVGEREDGTLWIVDGLQRLTAWKKLGKAKIRCEVFNSKGPEDEARIFTLVNLNRTKLTAGEQFKGMLTAGDQLAWQIKECVEGCGFYLSLSGGNKAKKNSVSCISALVAVAKLHGVEPIKFALEIARDIWPEDSNAVCAKMVLGLCRWYVKHEGLFDREKIEAKLKTITPYKVMYVATQSNVAGGAVDYSMAEVIEKVYKKRTMRKKP